MSRQWRGRREYHDSENFANAGAFAGAFADREILTIYFSSARNASLLRAAYYQLIPTILQQLNSAEWPQFCDHSVTSADVRLASA
jgi:hypothetical protein